MKCRVKIKSYKSKKIQENQKIKKNTRELKKPKN